MIDAHIHLFDDSRFTYDWSPEHRTAVLKGRRMPRGVAGEKFVVVEGGVIDRHGERESAWLSARARRTPRIAAVVVQTARKTGPSDEKTARFRLPLTGDLSPQRL